MNNIPQWDKEEVWTSIEKELDSKEPRRKLLIWWFLGSLVVAGCLYVLYPKPQKGAKVDSPKPIINKEAQMLSAHSSETVEPSQRKESKMKDSLAGTNIYQDNRMSIHTSSTLAKANNEVKIQTYHSSQTERSRVSTYREESIEGLKKRLVSTPASLSTIEKEWERIVPTEVSILSMPYQRLVRERIDIDGHIASTSKVRPWSYTIGSYIGYQMQYIDNADAFWTKRKALYEAPKESYLREALVDYSIGGFKISTGVSYEMSTKIVSLSDRKFIRSYTLKSDSAYQYTQNNVQGFLSGDRNAREYNLRKITSPNRMHRLYIPIQLAYSSDYAPWSIYGSLLYNVWRKDTGYYLDMDKSIIEKEQQDRIQELYSRKIHRLSLGTSYSIYRKGRQGIDIYARVLTDLNSHLAQFSERYTTIYIGATYRKKM